MKRKRGLERIDTVALRALKTFERNMRRGRNAGIAARRETHIELAQVDGKTVKTAQCARAVIPVGTQAAFVSAGEVQITPTLEAVNKAAADKG